jgi:lysylphosphatidylglycerol synthetase-like protein (DUF2156 family)/UDP-2,3-diacylglucosamine pyrophosphatase LpxH
VAITPAVEPACTTHAEALTTTHIDVPIPLGGRAVVASDLHLGSGQAATLNAAQRLTEVLDAWSGPGALILAGDTFELLEIADHPIRTLAGYPGLRTALRRFAGRADRHLVILCGVRDGRLAWDGALRSDLCGELGATVALTADLVVERADGVERIRVEHGHQDDPVARFLDPLNPADTPLATHLVTDLLPHIPHGSGSWLAGLGDLVDPLLAAKFAASRFAYRRVARHSAWLLVPLVVAFVVKLPVLYEIWNSTTGASQTSSRLRTLVLAATAVAVDLGLIGIVLTVLLHRTWRSSLSRSVIERSQARNDVARARARALITDDQYIGLITGHTHSGELSHLGHGFYANAGCGTAVTEECPTRWGLPPVFLQFERVSWVEVESGADVHVRLLNSRVDAPGGSTFVERLASTHEHQRTGQPHVVALWPHGSDWPAIDDPTPTLRRTRRIAATAIALAGVINLASAFTLPLAWRLEALQGTVPLAVSQGANALVVLAGVGLLGLARAVRRGQRLAWRVTIALLAGSFVLHLLKGIDLEEGLIGAFTALYLLSRQRAFRAEVESGLWNRLAPLTAAVLGGSVATSIVVLRVMEGARVPIGSAALGSIERLVGLRRIAFPDRTDDWIAPALFAVGIAVTVIALWIIGRPAIVHRRTPSSDRERARGIVGRHGHGTLDYFALRDDKAYFFTGDAVVAYGVFNRVCVVSPDPISPIGDEDRTWSAFRQHADRQGWTVAVLGASERWLPTYRASGMHDLYVGDEGVADATSLSLDGGKKKELRQAVNRIAKHGYTISFHDPSTIDPTMQEELRDLMTKSRRGEMERGFSMTLGRLFDPRDKGLLLAVCRSSEGVPVAMCHYVPAAGVNGYSLDLMRRDQGQHPNGLFDFVIVRTLEHLKAQGQSGLGLNFATMRAVLAGETGDGLATRVQRWFLEQMSDSMQIESLWRFNAKFDPVWQSRFVVYDGSEDLLTSALAIAKAESFWELPIIGRFLQPDVRPDDETDPMLEVSPIG